MQKWKLEISYEGTRFFGWQRQRYQLSIQGSIEAALAQILQQPIPVVGCSRTDAGVHACGQVAHILVPVKVEQRVLFRSLNALLPPEIRINALQPTCRHFHARYSAEKKTYRYAICQAPTISPFDYRYMTHLRGPLDREAFAAACHCFVGTHDFRAFANRSDRGSAHFQPRRTIEKIAIHAATGGFAVEICGRSFLYKMVRHLIGAAIAVGQGQLSLLQLQQMLADQQRHRAVSLAPPQGLCLTAIAYRRCQHC